MGRYSYSQPSPSEDLFCNSVDSDEAAEINDFEELIRRDQAEISLQHRRSVQYPPQQEVQQHRSVHYPPQPEVEFGFPKSCYCGAQPILATIALGRHYYTCEKAHDGECHVWKLWDVAVMEEMRATDKHVNQLAEKVENLSLFSDYETEQRMLRLENTVFGKERHSQTRRCSWGFRFELFVCLIVLVIVLLGMVIMLK